jgi:hypothetical protein
LKVIEQFKDKETKRIYQVNDNYDGDRVSELQQKGVLEKPKPKPPKKQNKKSDK